MSQIRDLLFQQETLNILLEKNGLPKDSAILPWNQGFAVIDPTGNITNYIHHDSNDNLIIQQPDFTNIGSVSSVAHNQFQVYDQEQLLGTLFTYPDSTYPGLTSFLSVNQGDTLDLLSDVADINLEEATSLLDITNLFDLI